MVRSAYRQGEAPRPLDKQMSSLQQSQSPDTGRIASLRGALILLVVSGSQFMDNVFNAAVSIALPAIQREFDLPSNDLQWTISAYTLTFGGFLLLSGVLSDRYGRRWVLCAGLIWLTVWTITVGSSQTFVQMAVFRAFQGIGAAMTVPSSVGIIASYYTGADQSRALSVFSACGAVGFCGGLIFGGFLSASLGWRYIFYIAAVITGVLAIMGLFVLPRDRRQGDTFARLDYMGAAMSTAGLVLLSFVLSSGGVHGWNRGLIIGLLVTSVVLLVGFAVLEKKVSNPIMPLSLWKLPSFALLWISAFAVYGEYQTSLYYSVLAAQQVSHLSPSATAIRFLPTGAASIFLSILWGKLVHMVNPKALLVLGMAMSAVAPVPLCMTIHDNMSFWTTILPTSLLALAGISLSWMTVYTVMLSLVPVNVKSLCGGMINTAFQFGSAVALAITSAITQEVDINKHHSLSQEYRTGLVCSAAIGGVGLLVSIAGLMGNVRWKNVGGSLVEMTVLGRRRFYR